MKYTEETLFALMDSRKEIRVTTVSGEILIGLCWAYSKESNEDDRGIAEASLDVGSSSTIFLSQIQNIEFVDRSSVEECVAAFDARLKAGRAEPGQQFNKQP